MPYRNIVFVKLEKRLLNDHRWYMMSESAQLIYIKLILLAAETYNKIPQNDIVLKEALRSRQDLETFKKCLKEIEQNFPKLKKNKHFRYFDEFETKTNYIPHKEIPRKSQGLPKVGADQDQDQDQDQDKDQDKEQASPALKAALNTVSKEGLNIYALLNQKKKEMRWAKDQMYPEEVLLGVCDQYSKNKASIKNKWAWFKKVIQEETMNYFANRNVQSTDDLKKLGMPEHIRHLFKKEYLK